MERFAIKKMLAWKQSSRRKPLILKGVRQVGKTWILKEFGKRYYKRKLFKSTLNNRLHRNLACAIDKSSRGAKLKRAFEELPKMLLTSTLMKMRNSSSFSKQPRM